MTEPVRSGRALAAACLGLAVAAALLWGASAATWYRVGSAEVAGGTVRPWLTGVALLALAGVAALVATAGLVRRGLSGLFGVAGAWVTVAAVIDLVHPAATVAAWTPAGLGPARPIVVSSAPLLAVAGGLVLLVVGGFVLLREPRLARVRLGGAPGEPRREHADPDRAAWAALDEGRDPTADSPGPDGGRGGGAV